jgi:hypothetical protein
MRRIQTLFRQRPNSGDDGWASYLGIVASFVVDFIGARSARTSGHGVARNAGAAVE